MIDSFQKIRLVLIVYIVLSLAITLGLFVIYKNSIPPVIPIFYTRPWGDTQLAPGQMILLIPGLILGLGLVLTFFSSLKICEKTLAQLMIYTGIAITSVMLFAYLRIFFLVVI